jgi:hypothetical protein
MPHQTGTIKELNQGRFLIFEFGNSERRDTVIQECNTTIHLNSRMEFRSLDEVKRIPESRIFATLHPGYTPFNHVCCDPQSTVLYLSS